LDRYEINVDILNHITQIKYEQPYKSITVIDSKKYIGDIFHNNRFIVTQNFFSRLYYLGYENIIYVDSDELLLTDNLDYFFNLKIDFCFSKGFEIIHKYDVEKDYDKNKKILEQRNYGVWNDVSVDQNNSSLNKIVIYKNGYLHPNNPRHSCVNQKQWAEWCEMEIDFNFYLFHLREIDVKTTLQNSIITNELYSKNLWWQNFNNEEEIKKRLNKYFIPNLVEIPIVIKNILKKHNL
jgi:hypothetical protein